MLISLDGKRKRPLDTVKPVADDLGLTVDTSCDRDDPACVKDVVDKYAGKGNILICWEHDALTEIVKELGDDDAPKYPSKSYVHFLTLSFLIDFIFSSLYYVFRPFLTSFSYFFCSFFFLLVGYCGWCLSRVHRHIPIDVAIPRRKTIARTKRIANEGRFDIIWTDPSPYKKITDKTSEKCAGLDD